MLILHNITHVLGGDLTKNTMGAIFCQLGPGGSTLIHCKTTTKLGWQDKFSFLCSIEITQNATWVPKMKSQAFKSGSNQMADA